MPSVMQTTSSMPGVGGLHDRVGGERRRHEDHRRVGAGRLDGLGDGVEDRDALDASRRPCRASRRRPPSCRTRGSCWAWNVPSLPVMPCTSRRVFLSTRIAHATLLPCRCSGHDLLRGVAPCRSADDELERRSRAGCCRPCSTLVPSRRTTTGTLTSELLDGRRPRRAAMRSHADDAAEDVDQHGLHLRVGEQDAERVRDLLLRGAAADVEEVRRLAAVELDDVHGRHRQAGAVDHAADVAVELDVVEAELAWPRPPAGPPRRGRAAPRRPCGGTARCRRS